MTSTKPTAPSAPRPNEPGPSSPSSSDAPTVLDRLTRSVGESVIGYDAVVRLLTVALISEGHVLLEGVPGIAKTMLVRRFSSALSLSFKRIQFTPDMLPSDIVGTVVLNPVSQEFEYRRGPVFANVVLADEINRAPPKVQSALLEAMQERQVTVDGVGYPLPRPFIVIATENPIEQEGTYPLPEAELDRFLFRILMGYPSEADERTLLERHTRTQIAEATGLLLDAGTLDRLREEALGVAMTPEILNFVMQIIRGTRNDARILMGASPRAGVQFLRATKAAALLAGRSYVTPGDVKSVVFDVLNHRILLHPDLLAQRYVTGRNGVEPLLREVLEKRAEEVPAPR
ncbi:MAG: AAA family ATPase [Thermoplasmata archaeon]|nr:AAA family ATPase [Thermoplasmata archaeon]MCI4332964.1 AAA family ATPase [Thermoplasmata archaeon]